MLACLRTISKRANIVLMKKHEAIKLLGGTVTEAAKAIGIMPQAVTQWPDDLPDRIADRVIAAIAKKDPKKWPSTWRRINKPELKEPTHA